MIDISTLSLNPTHCYNSDFDQYGDMEAFGVHPDWQRQLSKFASVQDRLREWDPRVMARLKVFSCMVIRALDIDAIRIDKATQVTLDGLADWAASTRACAAQLGKNNFLIAGEVTGGDTFGSLYLGRGRTPEQRPSGFLAAANVTSKQDKYFLRKQSQNALDAVAFHYSIYRSLTRFLGMDGNLDVAYDIDVNFVTAWNQMFVSNDFFNIAGELDPRHLYGTSNFDVFRWPSLKDGERRSALGTFITTLVMPGIPMVGHSHKSARRQTKALCQLYYGEEQNMYLFDSGAANYLFGYDLVQNMRTTTNFSCHRRRQAMPSTKAWQRHGCYKLSSQQYYNMPLDKALTGCQDDWNSLDHFDPTTDSRRLFAQFMGLRSSFDVLKDGYNVVQFGNWTHRIQLPGSNRTQTELGLWSVVRAGLPNVQTLLPTKGSADTQAQIVWLLYTNMNKSVRYSFACDGPSWISSPYVGGTTVRNLFAPYERYALANSRKSFFGDGHPPWTGCLPDVNMEAYGFKALVPESSWLQPQPALTGFSPGHDARIRVDPGDNNASRVDVRLEFSVEMNCQSVTNALSFNMSSSGKGGNPSIDGSSVQCAPVTDAEPAKIPGASISVWAWSATIQDVADGVLTLTLNNPATQSGHRTTGVRLMRWFSMIVPD
jgi:alpha-1,3-glucan synthase